MGLERRSRKDLYQRTKGDISRHRDLHSQWLMQVLLQRGARQVIYRKHRSISATIRSGIVSPGHTSPQVRNRTLPSGTQRAVLRPNSVVGGLPKGCPKPDRLRVHRMKTKLSVAQTWLLARSRRQGNPATRFVPMLASFRRYSSTAFASLEAQAT
jgi:hypothetical protein